MESDNNEGFYMARIIYKQYDAEGREIEQPPKEIITTGKSAFFTTPSAVNLIGNEKITGLLKTHSDLHAARLAEVDSAVQDGITHFLKQSESDKNVNIGPLLFPDTKKENLEALERKAKALHEALLRAAEWAVAKEDMEVYRFLTSVGEYAESVIQESPWEDAIPSELYRLTVLSKGRPQDFLKIEKDKKQLAFINEYVSDLNKVRQDCPKKVEINPDGTLSLAGKQFAERIQATHAKYMDQSIHLKIKEIEAKRAERQKTLIGKVINLFNFVQKYQLNNLRKMRDSKAVEVIFNLNNVAKGSAASKEKLDESARLIEAKRTIDNFNKENFIDHPGSASLSEVVKLRDAIKLLMDAPGDTSKLKKFIKEVAIKAIKNVKDIDFSESHINDLTVLLAFFEEEKTKGCKAFDYDRREIVNAIKNRLSRFLDPDKAIRFIETISKTNVNKLGVEIDVLLKNRLNQYQSWKEIAGFRAKVYANQLSDSEIELFYNHALNLLNNSTRAMLRTVESVVAPIKGKILKILAKPSPTALDKEIIKRYLKLFCNEKLVVPDKNNDLKCLIQAREEIKSALLLKLNKTNNFEDFKVMLAHFQTLWPEPIDSRYIEIHNQRDLPLFISDNQRLDQLTEVAFDTDVMNYAVGIGGVTLSPNEKRTFWCTPVMHDRVLQKAINDKAQSLVVDAAKDEIKKFAPRVAFLKSKEKSVLANIWALITGDDTTPLTPENQKEYVTDLVDDYVEALLQQRLYGAGNVREVINRQVIEDIEQVAKALNENLYALIHQKEQQKFSATMGLAWKPIDINHLLLQWSFINTFRTNFGSTAADVVYRRAGMDIINKIDEFSRNDPKFLHHFLGNMNKEQLNALNKTFVDMPTVHHANDIDIYSLDFIGDKQYANQEGETVLRKTLLLSAMSELVKQELLRFLNDEPVNINLFREHIAFVCEQLPELHHKAEQLNKSAAAVKVKEDLALAMDALLENTDHEKEAGMAQLIKHLVELQLLIDDEDKLKAFCLKYDFSVQDLKKREASLFTIANDIPAAQAKGVKLRDIFDKMDDGLITIVDTYIKKEVKADDALLLSDMKYRYAHLQKQRDIIRSAKQPFDLIHFIQGLNDSVVNPLPENLNQFCRQVQYAFADRFTQGIGQILGEANLSTTEGVDAKLKSLKSNEFYKLVCLVFEKEEDRENIFKLSRIKRPQPIQPTLTMEVSPRQILAPVSKWEAFKDNNLESAVTPSVDTGRSLQPGYARSDRQTHSLFRVEAKPIDVDVFNKDVEKRLLSGP